jgi:hypothetical protein
MRIWVMREEERRCLWFTHTHTCAVCVVGREDARRRKKERKEVQVSGGHRPFFLLDTHANNTFHPSQPTADWLEEEENAPGNNGADGPAFVQITVRQPRLSLSQPADSSSQQQQQQQSHHRPTNFSDQAKI